MPAHFASKLGEGSGSVLEWWQVLIGGAGVGSCLAVIAKTLRTHIREKAKVKIVIGALDGAKPEQRSDILRACADLFPEAVGVRQTDRKPPDPK